MKHLLTFAAVLSGVAMIGAPAVAEPQGAPEPPPGQHQPQAQPQKGPGRVVTEIKTAESPTTGRYLTDAQGRALYLFQIDKRGQSSACHGACAEGWPPALAGSGQTELGPNLNRDQLGTITRKDGSKQLTYGGWPLYYYFADTAAGQTGGQDLVNSGGEWNLVSPSGAIITAQPKAQPQQPQQPQPKK